LAEYIAFFEKPKGKNERVIVKMQKLKPNFNTEQHHHCALSIDAPPVTIVDKRCR
jgi:hypothetical protein